MKYLKILKLFKKCDETLSVNVYNERKRVRFPKM